MPKLFKNTEEGRLRTGWRILFFLFLLFGTAFLFVTLIRFAFGGKPDIAPLVEEFMLIGSAAISATFAVVIARRFLDRKTFKSLGLKISRRSLADIFFGFLLSALMAGSFYVIMVLMGLIDVSGINWHSGVPQVSDLSSETGYFTRMSLGVLTLQLILYVVVSWWEELVFRGYLFQNMVEGLGLVVAVVISCLLYGAVHALNPNASLLSSSIIVIFGLMRLYGYLATGELWLSFGMHAGWNFFQGPVFGFAASGTMSPRLIGQSPLEPEHLSGGAFGPEGSLLMLPILAAAIFLMWAWSRRKTRA